MKSREAKKLKEPTLAEVFITNTKWLKASKDYLCLFRTVKHFLSRQSLDSLYAGIRVFHQVYKS